MRLLRAQWGLYFALLMGVVGQFVWVVAVILGLSGSLALATPPRDTSIEFHSAQYAESVADLEQITEQLPEGQNLISVAPGSEHLVSKWLPALKGVGEFKAVTLSKEVFQPAIDRINSSENKNIKFYRTVDNSVTVLTIFIAGHAVNWFLLGEFNQVQALLGFAAGAISTYYYGANVDAWRELLEKTELLVARLLGQEQTPEPSTTIRLGANLTYYLALGGVSHTIVNYTDLVGAAHMDHWILPAIFAFFSSASWDVFGYNLEPQFGVTREVIRKLLWGKGILATMLFMNANLGIPGLSELSLNGLYAMGFTGAALLIAQSIHLSFKSGGLIARLFEKGPKLKDCLSLLRFKTKKAAP